MRQLAAPVGYQSRRAGFPIQSFRGASPERRRGERGQYPRPACFRPTSDYFSYQISKLALLTATEILSQALAPRVRVNGIAPGPALPSVHTTAERFAKRIEKLPLRKEPDLADFGRTVRYFVENRSITGETIALDGGQHIA